jgi:hypothetical protein
MLARYSQPPRGAAVTTRAHSRSKKLPAIPYYLEVPFEAIVIFCTPPRQFRQGHELKVWRCKIVTALGDIHLSLRMIFRFKSASKPWC